MNVDGVKDSKIFLEGVIKGFLFIAAITIHIFSQEMILLYCCIKDHPL